VDGSNGLPTVGWGDGWMDEYWIDWWMEGWIERFTHDPLAFHPRCLNELWIFGSWSSFEKIAPSFSKHAMESIHTFVLFITVPAP
jgi:hypothetical protein